jgi:hypothetical protein
MKEKANQNKMQKDIGLALKQDHLASKNVLFFNRSFSYTPGDHPAKHQHSKPEIFVGS